jgi:hypothetical protein
VADSTLVASIMTALHALFPAVPNNDVNGGMSAMMDTAISKLIASGNSFSFTLGNGLLIQFGRETVNINNLFNSNIGTYGWSLYYGTKSVNFPVAYAAGVVPYVWPVANDRTGAGAGASSSIFSLTNTSFSIISEHYSNSGNVPVVWIAIGPKP